MLTALVGNLPPVQHKHKTHSPSLPLDVDCFLGVFCFRSPFFSEPCGDT